MGIASVAGVRGLPGAGAYSASKAAAIAYLESARVELAPAGVRVVTIAPGYVRTAMTAPYLTDEWVDERAGSLVSGRLAEAGDVAAAIWYLAGDGAALMHGQTLHANGGGVLA